MIKTERLVLKNVEVEDASELFEFTKDPVVGYWCGWKAHESLEETKEVISTIYNRKTCFGIYLDEHIIGVVDLRLYPKVPTEAEIGFFIGPKYWNHGYMSEALNGILAYAFEKLSLELIFCAYYDGNEGSKRVQEKAGFKFDHIKENVFVPAYQTYRTSFVSKLSQNAYLKQVRK